MRLLTFLLFATLTAFAQNADKADKRPKGEDTFTEGMAAFLLEDYPKALQQFEAFVKIDDKSAAGFYMKSRTESILKQSQKAEISAEKAVTLDKQNYYYLQNLAQILTQNFKYKETKEAYLDLIKLKPEATDAYFQLLTIQVNMGESSAALKTLDLAEKQFGSSEKITLARQSILISENKLKQALKEGEKQMSSQPEFALEQAKVMIANDKPQDAIKLLSQTLISNPNFIDGYGLLSELYASQKMPKESWNLLETILQNSALPYALKVNVLTYHLRQFGKDYITPLRDKTEKLVIEYPEQARGFTILGDLYYRSNQIKKAQNTYKESVKLDKNQFEVWLALCQIDFQMADIKQLEKDAENATLYFPNQPMLWFYLGFAQVLNQKPDDAEISFEEAARMGSNANIEAGISEIIRKKGDTKKANELLTKVLNGTPSNEIARYLSAKNAPTAEESLRFSAELSRDFPQNNLYKLLLANALLLNNNTAEALQTLSFIKDEEQNSPYFDIKGDILFATEKKDDARLAWQKALELDKNNQSISNKLKKF